MEAQDRDKGIINSDQVPKLIPNIAAITSKDYDKFFSKIRKKPYTGNELKQMVPSKYHDYLDVWDSVIANKLPSHWNIDYHIRLVEGSTPIAKKTYGLSREQAAIVKEYIDEILGKGFICSSKLPYAAPVLIVKKLEGGFQICVDYCILNALTIKNRNTPPLIREMFVCLCSVRIYSKCDIIATFNKIYIQEGDEEKTAFHI